MHSSRILRFIAGRYDSAEFPLKDGTTQIGSEPELDMVLHHDDKVSARHARITVKDGKIVIEDLGSVSGTFVNGERIERATLATGDRVAIGGSTMVLLS